MKYWTRAEDEIIRENSVFPEKWLELPELALLLPHRSQNAIQNRRQKIGCTTGLSQGAYRRHKKRQKRDWKLVCIKCGKEFISHTRNRKYCAGYGKCLTEINQCEVCGRKFYKREIGSYPDLAKFCSLKCYRKSFEKIKNICVNPECNNLVEPRLRRVKRIRKLKDGTEKNYYYYENISNRYCPTCNVERNINNLRNRELKKNSLTRCFAKFIIKLREEDREEYLKIRRKCIEEFGKEWQNQFDKRLPRWYAKLNNGQSYRADH